MMAFSAKPRTVLASRASTVRVQAAKFRPESRIGKKIVHVPKGVDVKIDGDVLRVKGPKGELTQEINPLVSIDVTDGVLKVKRNEDSKRASAMHGLFRALSWNMIHGVSEGFSRTLELRGVGFRASASGQELTLNLGYSHPVVMTMPDGVTPSVTKNTLVTIEGANKEILGNIAAKIRAKRLPEPYKGKGVRYLDENVKSKAGKSGKQERWLQ
eukprot:TRINITY_DN1061_c1_g2_i1.p1 TRINITY_DN1061_c1_g2~~TRINITY_DN1061_c1_g2_i1.p1  ORF type:complete len:213 (-),score=13.13 TRINITY_DN1061_c1_g2_i1:276-914(-)